MSRVTALARLLNGTPILDISIPDTNKTVNLLKEPLFFSFIL